jgi:hypothetical protein
VTRTLAARAFVVLGMLWLATAAGAQERPRGVGGWAPPAHPQTPPVRRSGRSFSR